MNANVQLRVQTGFVRPDYIFLFLVLFVCMCEHVRTCVCARTFGRTMKVMQRRRCLPASSQFLSHEYKLKVFKPFTFLFLFPRSNSGETRVKARAERFIRRTATDTLVSGCEPGPILNTFYTLHQ